MSAETEQTTFQAQPLSFSEIVDLHKKVKQEVPFFKDSTLPQFSQLMNEQTGSQFFSQGLHDSKIKRLSANVDKFLTPITDVTGNIGANLGSVFGPKGEEIGRDVGEGLPRGAAEVGLATAGAAVLAPIVAGTAPLTLGAAAVGGGAIGLGALLSGSGTYEKTGSGTAGLISGASTALLPGAARLGSKLASKALIASPLYKDVIEELPFSKIPTLLGRTPVNPVSKVAGVGERFAEYLGGNLGAIADQELAAQGISLATTGQMQDPFTLDHAARTLASVAPFSALDLLHVIKGPSVRGGVAQDFRSSTEQMAAAQTASTAVSALKQDFNNYKTTKNKPVALLPERSGAVLDVPVPDYLKPKYPAGTLEVGGTEFPMDVLEAANRVENGDVGLAQFPGMTQEKSQQVIDLMVKRGTAIPTVDPDTGVTHYRLNPANAVEQNQMMLDNLKKKDPAAYEQFLRFPGRKPQPKETPKVGPGVPAAAPTGEVKSIAATPDADIDAALAKFSDKVKSGEAGSRPTEPATTNIPDNEGEWAQKVADLLLAKKSKKSPSTLPSGRAYLLAVEEAGKLGADPNKIDFTTFDTMWKRLANNTPAEVEGAPTELTTEDILKAPTVERASAVASELLKDEKDPKVISDVKKSLQAWKAPFGEKPQTQEGETGSSPNANETLVGRQRIGSNMEKRTEFERAIISKTGDVYVARRGETVGELAARIGAENGQKDWLGSGMMHNGEFVPIDVNSVEGQHAVEWFNSQTKSRQGDRFITHQKPVPEEPIVSTAEGVRGEQQPSFTPIGTGGAQRSAESQGAEAQLKAISPEGAGQLLSPTTKGVPELLHDKKALADRLRGILSVIFAGHAEAGRLPQYDIETRLKRLEELGLPHDEVVLRTINMVEHELAALTKMLPLAEEKLSRSEELHKELLSEFDKVPDYAVDTVGKVALNFDKSLRLGGGEPIPMDLQPHSAIEHVYAAAVQFYKNLEANVGKFRAKADPEYVKQLEDNANAAREESGRRVVPSMDVKKMTRDERSQLAAQKRRVEFTKEELLKTETDPKIAVEKAALYDYLTRAGSSRAQNQKRSRGRHETEVSKNAIDKEEGGAAPINEAIIGGELRGGKSAGRPVLTLVTEDMLDADKVAQHQMLAVDWIKDIFGPKGFSPAAVGNLQLELGGKRTRTDPQTVKRFNTAIQLFLDGHLVVRTNPHTGEPQTAMISGDLRPNDLQVLLGFGEASSETANRSALNYINTNIKPILLHLGELANEAVMGGGEEFTKLKQKLNPPPVQLIFQKGEEGKAVPDFATSEETRAAQERLLALAGRGGNPLSAHVGAERYFTRMLSARGYSGEEVQVMTQAALKIVGMFSPVSHSRILNLVDSGKIYGVRAPVGGANLIGLNTDAAGKFTLATRTWQQFQTLGHELWHAFEGKYNEAPNSPVAKALEAAQAMTEDDRFNVMYTMLKNSIPEQFRNEAYENFLTTRAQAGATDPHEFVADYAGLIAAGKASPADLQVVQWNADGTVKFQPDWVTQFAKGMYVNFVDLFEVTKQYSELLGIDTKNLTKTHENVLGALTDLKEVDQITKDFQRLVAAQDPLALEALAASMHDLNWKDITAAYGEKVRAQVGETEALPPRTEEERLGVKPNILAQWFAPARQLSERYPQLRPTVDLGFSFQAMARRTQALILDPFLTDTGLGRKRLDTKNSPFIKVTRSKEALEATTRIALIKNEREMVLTDGEMRDLMPGLSSELQDSVIQLHRGFEKSLPIAANVLVQFKLRNLAVYTARALMSENKLLDPEVAQDGASKLLQALQWIDDGRATKNQVKMMAGQTAMKELQVTLGKDAVAAALKAVAEPDAKGVSPYNSVSTLASLVTNKPWWMPEMRLGQYMVAWKNGARGFDSKADMLKFANEMEAKGTKVNTWDKYDRNNAATGIHPVLLNWFQNVEQPAFEAAINRSTASPEVREMLEKDYKPGQQAWKEFTSKGFRAHELPRKLAEGRESLDFVRGYTEYVAGLTNGVSREYTKNRFSLALDDPKIRNEPTLKRLAEDYMKNVLFPSAKEMKAVKNLNFLMYMGGNLSTMMVELSQPLLTLMPHMTRFSNKPWESFNYLRKAGMDIAKTFGSEEKRFANVEEQKAMDDAAKEGIVDFGVLADFFDAEDLGVANLQKLTRGDFGALQKPIDLLKKPLTWYLHATRSMYSMATRWNSRIAFLTAYRMARDGKIFEPSTGKDLTTPAEAYQFAVRATQTTMYTGGPAGRPVGLFANSGKWFGAVGAMYSLQSYSYSSLAMLGRLFSESIGKVDYLTPVEKTAARKAMFQMLATQFVIGGAYALPFVGAGAAVAEQLFPDLEAKKALRNVSDTIAGMFTDDDELKHMISDVGMRGAVTKVLGADVSAKVQLGNILGVDPYQGFSLNNLIGPTGSVFQNIVNAAQSGLQGKFGEAASVGLPTAYRGVVDLARNGGDVRDRDGRLLLKATPLEQAWMAVGFKPETLATLRERNTVTKRSEEIAGRQQDDFHLDLAKQLLEGDNAGVRNALLAKQRENPDYSARAGAERVAQLAQELGEPYDPTQSGVRSNMSEREKAAQLFNAQPHKSEVQLMLERKKLEGLLQVPGAGAISPTLMRSAQMVDALMAQNPLISRQQAQAMVEAQFHQRARQF